MGKRQFFKPPAGMTAGEIAALTGATPRAGSKLDHVITDVASLDLAGPDDLAYFENVKFKHELSATRAGACLIAERLEKHAPAGLTLLVVKDPHRAFVAVTGKLFPQSLRPSSLFESEGVAPNAFVHKSARLEAGVIVDPAAVIGPRAEIGAGSVIGATAVIGPGVHIGRHCAVGPGASISHALIGDRVIIHAGCRIGQDGFGFVMGPKGHVKAPQIGRVIIQDDVEIGANSTIDRGSTRDTMIGEGTKIDNLVQIAHNVVIGRHCIIVALSGISGSTTLGDFVVLGGNTGVIDHITIGDGAQLAARSGVIRDVPAGARWGGVFNAKPAKEWMREITFVERAARRYDPTAPRDK
jgi:UDP-3-O-[3-hydroxymyristoyl] glucosamine N-acyltransferase